MHVGLSVCVVVRGGCTVRGSVHDNCLNEVWHRMKRPEIDKEKGESHFNRLRIFPI